MDKQIKQNKQENKPKPVSGLSAKMIERLNKQPIIETNVNISEDKKWIIHRTTITDIRPVKYFEKVLEGSK